MLGFLPRKLAYYKLAFLPKSATIGQEGNCLLIMSGLNSWEMLCWIPLWQITYSNDSLKGMKD